MGEEHLNLLSPPLRCRVKFRGCAEPCEVSDNFVFLAADAARSSIWTALGFRWASLTVEFQAAILSTTGLGF